MISLFMQGGASHLDLFDPKPELQKRHMNNFTGDIKYDNAAESSAKLFAGPWKFAPHRKCGIKLSELVPHVAEVADDITLIRSRRQGARSQKLLTRMTPGLHRIFIMISGTLVNYSTNEIRSKDKRLRMAKPKVLIVEDDPDLTDVLAYNLRQAGYEAIVATDGREGLRQARLVLPDVMLLDLMLPLVDGLEVCRRLRSDPATANLLILMLTAKAEEVDQIVGLTMGADDYVTKPFSVKVLMERIKALRRRHGESAQDKEVIASQGIVIDRRRHQATAEGRPLELTQSEFRLLETLVRQPGRAFHRNELIESALGSDSFVLERTIDVHIRSLRQKLGDHAHLIETVRGVGYRFHEGA